MKGKDDDETDIFEQYLPQGMVRSVSGGDRNCPVRMRRSC